MYWLCLYVYTRIYIYIYIYVDSRLIIVIITITMNGDNRPPLCPDARQSSRPPCTESKGRALSARGHALVSEYLTDMVFLGYYMDDYGFDICAVCCLNSTTDKIRALGRR